VYQTVTPSCDLRASSSTTCLTNGKTVSVCVSLLSEFPNKGSYIFVRRSPFQWHLRKLCDRARKIYGLHTQMRKACAVFRNILVAGCVSPGDNFVTLTSRYTRRDGCTLRTVSRDVGTARATSVRLQTLHGDDALKH
jgi:hypothetical protein